VNSFVCYHYIHPFCILSPQPERLLSSTYVCELRTVSLLLLVICLRYTVCVLCPSLLTLNCLRISIVAQLLALRVQQNTQLLSVEQWFLTGGTRTPWGYEEPKQGVRSTKTFRDTRPENLNQIFLNIHRNSL